ncbi:hypothetical protein ADUPG1_001472, partial [Aduncisulcus paluster]
PDRPLKGFGSGISFQSSDKDSVNSSDDDKHTQSIPSFGLSLSHISSSRTNAISSLSRLPSIESKAHRKSQKKTTKSPNVSHTSDSTVPPSTFAPSEQVYLKDSTSRDQLCSSDHPLASKDSTHNIPPISSSISAAVTNIGISLDKIGDKDTQESVKHDASCEE